MPSNLSQVFPEYSFIPLWILDKITMDASLSAIVYTYDGSHSKHGKKGFHNWINELLKQENFPWFNLPTSISNDKLRIELKRTFNYYWPISDYFWHFLYFDNNFRPHNLIVLLQIILQSWMYFSSQAKRAEWGRSLDFSTGLELVKNVSLSPLFPPIVLKLS